MNRSYTSLTVPSNATWSFVRFKMPAPICDCIASTSGNMRGQEMADLLVANLRKIERVLLKTNAPFVAVVTRTAIQVLEL